MDFYFVMKSSQENVTFDHYEITTSLHVLKVEDTSQLSSSSWFSKIMKSIAIRLSSYFLTSNTEKQVSILN